MAQYRIGDDVRYREIDGFGFVLDLRSQRYNVLDEVSASAWAALTGSDDVDRQVRCWTEHYELSADEGRAAISAFGEDCARAGWLCAADGEVVDQPKRQSSPSTGWARRLPRTIVAIYALATTALSIKFRGFSRTYCESGACAPLMKSVAYADLGQATDAFVFAENFILFRRGVNDCLVRSIALFRYLGWLGIDATHVIGVRRTPFSAHAWVEVGGNGLLAAAPRSFFKLAELSTAPR